MNFSRKILALSIVISFPFVAYANDVYSEGRPIVEISNGKLQGVENSEMVYFKNIPYAAPPVGELRWRPPQPAKNWEDIKDAAHFGQACVQPKMEGLNAELAPGIEDCLKLNVYAPKNAKNSPVMVWIHGGGLVEGSASEPYYYPRALVKEGAIVVTIDYRLGKLGFFAPKEIVEEAKKNNEPFGNYGYMDQIQSLKWVKENISKFGGNPDNVTIFGQSAGGRAVVFLMSSDVSKGLFNKAIAQSAQQIPTRDLSKNVGGMPSEFELEEKYMDSLNVKTLKELRNLPAQSLLVTPKEFQEGEFGGSMIDGTIVKANPLEIFSKGEQQKVPFIIGTNSWDASYFSLGQMPVDSYVKKMGEDINIINKLYSNFANKCDLTAQIMADGWYKGSVKLLADYQSKVAPSYAYYYDYLSPNVRNITPGAAHTFELPYVFGSLDKVLLPPNEPQTTKDQCKFINKAIDDMKYRAVWSKYWFPRVDPNNLEDKNMSEQISKSWVNFAKTGNPNVDGTVLWNQYDIQTDTMRLFKQGNESIIKNLDKERVDYQIKAIKHTY